ncbi:MAG: hypothetical protein HDR01_07470 [Lachnospiraceae bacterium]|nr:hypothetical protein [Lachnospiraceae bacterium]
MSKKINKLVWIGIWILVFALSVLGALKTVYISADIDESYTVTMACRLVKGDRLFLDMWELHQTSALLYAPFVWLFQQVNGSVIGMLVYLRIIGVCIQGLLTFFLYRICRNYMGGNCAGMLAMLFFNFTPKHIQSPEYALMCYWGLVLTMMSILRFYEKQKGKYAYLYLVWAAVGLSVTVLSYPAAVFLLFPFLAVIAYLTKLIDGGKEKKYALKRAQIWKNMGIFTGSCAVCGLLFMAYVLSGTTFKGLLETTSYVLMDESHAQVMSQHIWSHLQYLWDMLKVTLPAILICHIGRILWRRWKKKESNLFATGLLLFQAAYALVQFHTINSVNFLIFFPIILQTLVIGIYFYLSYEKTEKEKVLFYTMIVPNLFLVVIVLLSSNLTANYSMSFLFPAVLAGLYMIVRAFFERKSVEGTAVAKKSLAGSRGVGKAAVLLFAVVFSGMVFTSRIFLVRYTATQRLNVFEPNYKAWHGVLSGIRLGDTDYRQYEWKTASLHEHVTKDDVFLYVGADMFLYGETEAAIGTGNTISTPAFGEQLLAYYERFPERIPTVIFLDCEYTMDYRIWLEKEPFGSFMRENYEEPVIEGPLYIYKLRES